MTKALLDRYWKAQDPFDPDGLAACRHPQWSLDMPQTGERYPNHEADVLIHTNYPDYPRHERGRGVGDAESWAMTPMFTPVRVQGAGNLWISEARLTYPEQGRWYTAEIIELKDDLIVKETAYFAQAFDPPEWRADLVEPIPDEVGSDADFHEVPSDPAQERDNEAAVRRFYDAPGRAASTEEARALYQQAMAELLHPDATQDLVQSGERFRGIDRILELMRRQPDVPKLDHIRRIAAVGDKVVIEARLRYGQGIFWEVLIFAFRDGKVASSTEYYAEELEAPAWRSQWVEPL